MIIFFMCVCWGRLGCSGRELDDDGDAWALRTLASLIWSVVAGAG